MKSWYGYDWHILVAVCPGQKAKHSCRGQEFVHVLFVLLFLSICSMKNNVGYNNFLKAYSSCSISVAWLFKANSQSSLSWSVSEVSYSLTLSDCLWCLSLLMLKSTLISLCCDSFAALVHFCSWSVNIDLLKDKLILW